MTNCRQAKQICCDILAGLEVPMADLRQYDLAIIGGGIAGASLGRSMAEAGARVLILEGVNRFTDRVRGEGLLPWGGGEIERLGLKDCFAKAGASGVSLAGPIPGSAENGASRSSGDDVDADSGGFVLSPENADVPFGGG